MKVFISHINEEAALAQVLKQWIEGSLQPRCEVFVSSDPEDLPLGDKWLQTITQQLTDATVMLILCSARSIERPWINFEAGFAFARQIPIIPFCHSGFGKGDLPRPLSDFQAEESADPSFARTILGGIATHGDMARVPPIDFEQMAKEIRDAEREVSSSAPTPVPTALSEVAIDVLRMVVTTRFECTARTLAAKMGLELTLVEYHLDELRRKGLVEVDPAAREAEYKLTETGWKFLVERGLIRSER